MAKSETHIIECAISVISRYGYKKTTMADLADAAGVSRQTLYNKYPNKEQVLRAAIRFGTETGLAQVAELWASGASVAEKIDMFFQIGPLNWYDMIMASPDSADLIEGFNTHAVDEMAEGTKRWVEALTGVFAPFETKLAEQGISTDAFADFFYTTSANAKYNATSRAQLETRLATLRATTLATLGER